ncbi:MAG: type II secretion system protein GspG, partial [Verrucomicrobiota bacterium]
QARGTKGQLQQGYLQRADIPSDPWEGNYLYLSPGEHGPYDLYSLGADGQEGGEGYDSDIFSRHLK